MSEMAEQIIQHINTMYFIIRPGIPEVLNTNCYLDYGRARADAARKGVIVTNDSWLTQRGVNIKTTYGDKGKVESVTLYGAAMNLVEKARKAKQ